MDSELVGLAKGKPEMIVLAGIATVLAIIWAVIVVVFADGMPAVSGVQPHGTIFAAWIIVSLLWIAVVV